MSRLIFFPALVLFFISGGCRNSTEKSSDQNTSLPLQSVSEVTITDVETGIRSHISERTSQGNGYFSFSNDTLDLNLKLVRVHTEYLSVLSPNRFFACVDLATVNGDVYDVDFFLEGTAGNMKVTRTDLHKLNGQPFYTWKQTPEKTWITVPIRGASNDLLGVIEGTDRFTFNYQLTVPDFEGAARLWMPVASSDAYQQVEILDMKVPGNYRMTADEEFGNQILFVELLPKHGGKTISIRYQVTRTEKSAYPDPDSDTSRYLKSTPLLPVGQRFGTIARSVIRSKKANTSLTKARALYDHVIEEVKYAKQGTYGTGDANYACDSKSGNCTEFHSYFISLARSAGIPARFAVGAAIPSSRDEGGVNGYHCWAEFYAEGKWWPVDISEADKYTALSTYYFGHHPANRIEFSRGRDIRPDPMPASGPVNFLAYPVFEIEGKPDRVATRFTFQRISERS